MLCCFGQSSKGRKAGSVPCSSHAPLPSPQLVPAAPEGVPVASPCPKALLILLTKDSLKDRPSGNSVALVEASLGVGSPSVQLACTSAPAGYTPSGYAQLLSALAAHDGMFRAALWATSTMQGPANDERTLTLQATAPPGWDAACSSLLTTNIQLHYTQHNPSFNGSTAVPALCLEHLPPISMGRTSSDLCRLNPGDLPIFLHAQSPKAPSSKVFCSSSRILPSHVGSGASQVGSRTSSLTAGARPSNPVAEHQQQLQNRRSQLMHGELPISLTLFTQDGFVLEQNFNSTLYYGQIKGKPMWKGNLSRKIVLAELEEAEPEEDVGPLEQLFSLAPAELKMLLEHLRDPSQGPWKGTIQVTPTSFTSEPTFRKSPGRPSLGHLQGLETAPSVRPGAGELPPPHVGLDRKLSVAGVGGVTSRNAQSSRLASQLAVKQQWSHTFHEKNLPHPSLQAPLGSLPQDLASMCSSGPKSLSPYGSLAAPWDRSVVKDSHFLMSQRNHSFMSSSPDDQKSTSRSKQEQPRGLAASRPPSGETCRIHFEPGLLSASREELQGAQGEEQQGAQGEKQQGAQGEQGAQHQYHKCRSQTSDTNPTDSPIEHSAHERSSHTPQSTYPAGRTCPEGRRSHRDRGPGVADAEAADRAACLRSVRHSSSCSDLGNPSAGAHCQDRQQMIDRVQDLDSRMLGQLPNGCIHHGDSQALQGLSHGWQAQTFEEELQRLEGSNRSSPKDPQRMSAHGSDAKDRQTAKPESSTYHEVEVKLVPDPVTNRPAFLLIQRDVSEQVELENLLAELIEDQLAMLSQVFPRHVIQALTTHGAVTLDNIADLTYSHTDVTILFLDIVSFTSTCGKESITPESVIMFLNVLFSRFDKLVQEYHVQKIDTIGDAYLVASGILAPDGEGFWAVDQAHDAVQGAARMMSLAVDMLRAALEIRMPDHQPVNLRIGLHTGPCVSGLVGLEIPKWSVFGDTVNTSARMEQTGVPGTIQISNATKRLLPDLDLELKHSGAVAMKGKGTMETWLWHQPQEWMASRDAGTVPLLPKAVELLHRHCGIDGADGDANEEELPTVQLLSTFLPSIPSCSRQLLDPNSSATKIKGFGGFNASTRNKSTRHDSETPAASRGASQSQEPTSRDSPTLVWQGSVPSLPSNPSMNCITLDDAKALEKALGSSSQSPFCNQAPPHSTQIAAPALNKWKDPAISRTLHRLTNASLAPMCNSLVVTEAMKGLLQVQEPPSSSTAGPMSARESLTLSAAAMRKPGDEGPPSARTAANTQEPVPESPLAAASNVDAAARGCNSQSSNKLAPKECGDQRKHVDKLSWAPEPHMGEGQCRRHSQASEEETVEARESMDRVGMFGPKVFEILRRASNSPISSDSQVDSTSFHRINFNYNSLYARRSPRNSASARCLRRASSNWHSTASASQFTSFGADWTTLSARSSPPTLTTTRSLPLPSCFFNQQLESPRPTQFGARGVPRQSFLKRNQKGQPRVLQSCHSDPLSSSTAFAYASTSTRGSQSGLRGHTIRSKGRHRFSEGAPKAHWGRVKPGRQSPQEGVQLPTKSVQFACDRESARQRTAAVAATAGSSPFNAVQQVQQQVVVEAPSSTQKTGSASSRGMVKEEGSFSMPIRYKVAAILGEEGEEEEAGIYAHGDESYEKSHTESRAAHLVAKLAELPDKPIILGSFARTSSKRPGLTRKMAHVSAGCNVLPCASINSQGSAIPSNNRFKSLASARGMTSQANVLQPSQANALPRCSSSVTRGASLSRASTLGMSSQANAIFPAAGNSVYKTLAKAHAHIGSGTGLGHPSMSFNHHQPTNPDLASATGSASRPSLAQMRRDSSRGTSGRRSSLYRDASPQSLQP